MSDRRLGSADLFPTDHPVEPTHMMGRADDVDRVVSALLGGGNVVLAGPRRTGKTTVADAALEACRRDGAYVAAVDLFDLVDASDLARWLTIRLLSNRPALRRALGEASGAGRQIMTVLRQAAVVRARHDLGDGVELVFEVGLDPQDADSHARLRAALELAERLAQRDGKRVVIFFDEFQEIVGADKRFGDPDQVTRLMRSVLQRSRNVSVLFAGSIEHLMRDLFAPSDRALSQFGAFHELAPITAAQWQIGIRARLGDDDTTITDDALDRVVSLGEGHPRATMLLIQQAHAGSVEELRREIDHALVVQALERAMRQERLRHDQQLELIRTMGRHAERMAIRVAAGAELYANLKPQQAARGLARLHDRGLIARGERVGRWSVIDPLLRRYLASRRLEPLSFVRSASDSLEISDDPSAGAP
ncbi:MAG: ATP-binding protein [Actinobacteria bacterium]|nr:ATP-binding protein [Actinomycetota bacterium]